MVVYLVKSYVDNPEQGWEGIEVGYLCRADAQRYIDSWTKFNNKMYAKAIKCKHCKLSKQVHYNDSVVITNCAKVITAAPGFIICSVSESHLYDEIPKYKIVETTDEALRRNKNSGK